jgi:5-methylcytosine-specific restriction endonuclease McrA
VAKGGIAARARGGGKLSTTQRLAGVTKFDRARAGTLTRVDPATWAKICAYIKNRDGYKCTRCNSPDNLTVDHIIPHANGGQTTYNNLTTLCRDCHKLKLGKANKLGARLL